MADPAYVAETRRFLQIADEQTRAGELTEAFGTYRLVARRHPAVPVGWLQAAVAARACGAAEACLQLLRAALVLDPALAPATEILVAASIGETVAQRHRAAAMWAIANPRNAQAQGTLASSHHQAGRSFQHLVAARRALALDPGLAWVRANIAGHFREEGRTAEADAELRRAALLDPASGLVWRRLAGLREVLSALDGAGAAACRALVIDPGDHAASVIQALVDRRQGRLEEALGRLEALPEAITGEIGRDMVEFELGTIQDRLGQPAAAYEHFARANTIAASRAPAGSADPSSSLKIVGAYEAAVTPDWLDRWTPLAEQEAPAVFMVGFPRSGTTLLDLILDAHPDVRVIEEKPVLADLGTAFAEPPDTLPSRLAGMTEARAETLRANLTDRLRRCAGANPPRVLVDKMPLNTVYLPLILRLYPRARIILSLRHPCDCCLSCFMQPIRLNPAMANFTSMDGATALYARVMGIWEQVAGRLSANHEIVRYEDLIADVEGTARRVLDFLELDWNDAVVDHVAHARSRGMIRTPSFRQVSEPIYTRAKGRWEKYRPQMEPYLDRLRPYITGFGYDDPT